MNQRTINWVRSEFVFMLFDHKYIIKNWANYSAWNPKDNVCTITSKINVTPKRCLLTHLEGTFYFSLAHLLAHNNKSQICYCGQISLATVCCSFLTIWYLWGGGNFNFAGDCTVCTFDYLFYRIASTGSGNIKKLHNIFLNSPYYRLP